MPGEKVSKPFGETVADIRNSYVQTAADAGPRQCAECGHAESKHFSCAIGSFCKECPTDDYVWEHMFRTTPPVPQEAAPTSGTFMDMDMRLDTTMPVGQVDVQDSKGRRTIMAAKSCHRCGKPMADTQVRCLFCDAYEPAPDSAMRVAREIVPSVHENYAFDDTLPEREAVYAHVANLIREAGSERERVENDPNFWFYFADRVGEKIGWPFTKLEELAEILKTSRPSRLLGGESCHKPQKS